MSRCSTAFSRMMALLGASRPSGAKIRRPMSEVVEAWHDVTRQVEAADLLLGVQFDTPEREPERGAFMPYNEGQGYER